MKTRVTPTPIPDLVIVDVDYFQDERGFFIESWSKRDFADAGLPHDFVQDSHSRSMKQVLRGLHYQDMRAPMGKLVRCTVGRILDMAVVLISSRQRRVQHSHRLTQRFLDEGHDTDGLRAAVGEFLSRSSVH